MYRSVRGPCRFLSQHMKAQRVIWLWTNTEKNIWTFPYPIHMFSILSLLDNVLTKTNSEKNQCQGPFLKKLNPRDANWQCIAETSLFVVSLANFVHLNFKGFVFMVCSKGKITKPAKSSISNRKVKAKACCQTNLISFFLSSKPCVFTAVTKICRRKTSETKSRY